MITNLGYLIKCGTLIIKLIRYRINVRKKLLMTVEFQPEIFPTACDALQLEWEKVSEVK